MDNPYVPMPVTLTAVRCENDAGDLKTFDFAFDDPQHAASFEYVCGQFAMVSINGVGEAPFGIASSPKEEGFVRFTIKKYATGSLTTALHDMIEGDRLGLRGPFGNGFPVKELEGKNLLIVGGGFALTTLRSLAMFALHEDNRSKYGDITMFVAARDPGEILYRDDLAEWDKRDDIEVVQTIDREAEGWTHRVGFAAPVLEELSPSTENTAAVVCGPPIMIKTCIAVLDKLNFPAENIINSLEMKMKCGIGKCGRCNVGSKYICKDGPVFTYKELQELSDQY